MEAAKPKPWENTAIDWTVLGLPECPTEEDYRSILDYQYIIDHAENKDQLTENELSNIQTTYVKHYHQYQEMLDAEQITSEISTEQIRWMNLMEEIRRYSMVSTESVYVYDFRAYDDLPDEEYRALMQENTQKLNETGKRWDIVVNAKDLPDYELHMTWEELLAELNAAKEWDFHLYG